MANVFSALNKLKNNIFGGPGNTGFTKPPASRVQDIDLQPSPTGLLEDDPLYIDDIVSKGEMEKTQALTLLLQLELKGAVVQLSGKQFARA